MNGRNFSIIICSLITGILLGRLHFINSFDAIYPVLGASGCYFIGVFLTKRYPFHNFNWINDFTAVFLFLGIGIFSICSIKPEVTDFKKGQYSFRGKVEEYTATNYGDKLLVKLSDLSYIKKDHKPLKIDCRNIKAMITLQSATLVNYNCEISGTADLQPVDYPSNYRNDDYVNFLKRKGIYLTGFTEKNDCRLSKPEASFSSCFLSLRDILEEKIELTPLSSASKSFLISVLLGDKTYIDKTDRLTFSDAGVAHIFAVSGLHVSLLTGGLLAVLSILFIGKNSRYKYLVCLPFLWFYIFLVGYTPATCRAGIMLSLAFISFFLQRKYNPLKALGWSVILILSFMPLALFDIGFQLSVVCVGSLIMLAGPMNFVDRRVHPRLYYTVSLILISLVATFSSWLICAYYFHRFSLMFLPLNLIAVPLLPLYLIVSLSYLILFWAGINIPILCRVVDTVYSLFLDGASFVTSLSSPIENLHPHFLTVACWITGLVILAIVINSKKLKKRMLIVPCAFFIFAVGSLFFIPVQLPDGFIIQKNSSSQTIMCYNKGEEKKLELPEGQMVSAMINEKLVFAVRTSDISDTGVNQIRKADYVMLCEGCRKMPEKIKEYLGKTSLLVTHPSLHWRYEKNIREEAQKQNIPLYSLRYDGPLHIFD